MPRQYVRIRVGEVACLIPLGDVLEVLRPLAVEPVAGMPAWVRGVALVRGAPTPVVALGTLLGIRAGEPRRWVRIRGDRGATVLEADEVFGVVEMEAGELPALLRERGGALAAVAARDAELLRVLEAARVQPPAPGGARA